MSKEDEKEISIKPHSDTSFILSVTSNSVVLNYTNIHNVKCTDSSFNSVSDFEEVMNRMAEEMGIGVGDLRILCSSSMDFPEDETSSEDIIQLAYLLR